MLSYEEMKKKLKKQTSETRYFTKDFYSTFLADYNTMIDNVISGKLDEKELQNVFRTDFYNLESCGYCAFLEVFYSSMPRFDIRWYADFENYVCNYRVIISYPTIEIARKIAAAYMPKFDAKTFDIIAA